MIEIGRTPKIRGMAIPALGALAALFGSLTAGAFGWSGPGRWLAILGWLPVVVGATLLYLRRRYRPLQVDFTAGTAVLGGEEVPLTQVVGATRLYSVGIGAAYLEYRFEAVGGAWARVLVEGRPVRGLDVRGRALLRRFIEHSAIEGPPPAGGRSASQEVLLLALSTPAWRAVPVDTELLLTELEHLDPPPRHLEEPDASAPGTDATAEGTGAPGTAPDPELALRWLADDVAAEEWLRANPVPGRRARRLLGWLTVLVVMGFGGMVAFGAFQESRSASGRLDDDLQDVLAGLMVVVVLAAGVTYLAYAAARMRHQRAQLAAARQWAALRGPEQIQRGLPPVLLLPFFQRPPGHHLRAILAWVLVTVGVLLALSGAIAISTGDLGAGTGLTVGGAGLVLLAASAALFVASRRRAKAHVAEAVQFAGARLSFRSSGREEAGVSQASDGPFR